MALPGLSRGPGTARRLIAQDPHQRASLLSHQSSQAGTSTRAKAWVPTPYSWDRPARSIPHVAKWKHLASAPCRHQRLPASILKPPRLPLAEDTSACGKAEGSGAYRTGGGGESPCSPIHCLGDPTAMPRDGQHSFQHGPLLEVRSSAHRSGEPRWYACRGEGPGTLAQPSCLYSLPA